MTVCNMKEVTFNNTGLCSHMQLCCIFHLVVLVYSFLSTGGSTKSSDTHSACYRHSTKWQSEKVSS